MNIRMTDIRKRISGLTPSTNIISRNFNLITENAKNASSMQKITEYIRCWRECASSNEIAFSQLINIFESYCDKTNNLNEINSIVNIIIEEVTPSVADAKKGEETIVDDIKRNTDELKRLTAAAKDNAKNNINDIKNKIKGNVDKEKNKLKDKIDRVKAKINALKGIKESLNKYSYCDRIIDNHNKISKRFNIDKLFSEARSNNVDYEEVLMEFYRLLDTYKMPFTTKINVALENGFYLINKHNIDCSKSELLENTIEYYLCKECNESTMKDICRVLNVSVIFEKKDIENIEHLIDPKLAETQFTLFFNRDDETFDYDKYESKSKPLFEQKNQVKELLDNAKREINKSPEKLKELVKKMYAKSVDNVLDETPNFLTWIRKGLVIGTFAMNPIIGILTLFVDQFIAMGVKRSEAEKMVNKFESEKAKIEKKIDKATNDNRREKLEQYLSEIDKKLDKLKEYRDSLYSEKELDERNGISFDESRITDLDKISINEYYNNHHARVIAQLNSSIKNPMIRENVILNMDEISGFKKVEENSICKYTNDIGRVSIKIGISENMIEYSIPNYKCINDKNINGTYDIYFEYAFPISIPEEISEKYMSNELLDTLAETKLIMDIEEVKTAFVENIENDVEKLGIDVIEALSELSCSVDIIDRSKLISCLEEYVDIVSESNSINRFINKDILNNAIYNLKNSKSKNNISLEEKFDILESLNSIYNSNTIYESSFSNTIAIAKDKLKKAMVKMSDKEKSMSKSIDASMSRIKAGLEKSVSLENREAIIKGQLFPSFSKMIKTALVVGTGAVIAPVLTVIGSISALAMAKTARAKERQMILDEIETEIKVCDKHIQLAEQRDDMKAYRECLNIKRKLEREKSRIRYKMKIYYKQNPDAGLSKGDDD